MVAVLGEVGGAWWEGLGGMWGRGGGQREALTELRSRVKVLEQSKAPGRFLVVVVVVAVLGGESRGRGGGRVGHGEMVVVVVVVVVVVAVLVAVMVVEVSVVVAVEEAVVIVVCGSGRSGGCDDGDHCSTKTMLPTPSGRHLEERSD